MSPSRSADLKIALIGAGSISGYHANGVRAAGRASISVLVGGRRERTEARARALGIPCAETDYRRVLADSRIDGVIVASPDDTHERIAIDALSAGKAVLLQKPMGLSTVECRRILAAEAKADAQLRLALCTAIFLRCYGFGTY